MNTYNLPTYGCQKSFYGKAKVIDLDNLGRYLKSYNTIVGYIDHNNNFHRIWNGYSQTTMRHINSFLKHFGVNGGGANWWRDQRIEISELAA